MNGILALCGHDGCRLLAGHRGRHTSWPTKAWDFLNEKDQNKLAKAGFATPRGGDKGGYQNHVNRNNTVIIPYERLDQVDLANFADGYVVRLLPSQCFSRRGVLKPEFQGEDADVQIGANAFVLYGSHKVLADFPPPGRWKVRSLWKDGEEVEKRGRGVEDRGHYIVRAPKLGELTERREGPPQGLFGPEYANEDTNFLCKSVLAWLTIQAKGSPYTMAQAGHLKAVLADAGLHDAMVYERTGALRHGLASCPLCMRIIGYAELHDTVGFEDAEGLENAAVQTEGATRSTVVNLFHMLPLGYRSLEHIPQNVAWGHAICNTRLGQRRCFTLGELQAMDLKVGIVREEGIDTFGWISEDLRMIRSAGGAVWIQLHGNFDEEDDAGEEDGDDDPEDDADEGGG